MDLKKVASFCLVAKHKSYQKASKASALESQVIRKHVLSLEKNLEAPLVFQEGKATLLTEAGRQFYPHCQQILARCHEALEAVKGGDTEVRGRLSINTTVDFASLWFCDLLKPFVEQYPHLLVNVQGTALPADLQRDEADVVICPHQKGMMDAYYGQKLMDFKMGLYVHEHYLDRHGMPHDILDLTSHKVISYAGQNKFHTHQLNWHLHDLPQSYVPPFSISTGEGILRAIENGMGIGPVSEEGAHVSREPLTRVLPHTMSKTVEIYGYCTKEMSKSLKIRCFLEQFCAQVTLLKRKPKPFEAPP